MSDQFPSGGSWWQVAVSPLKTTTDLLDPSGFLKKADLVLARETILSRESC